MLVRSILACTLRTRSSPSSKALSYRVSITNQLPIAEQVTLTVCVCNMLLREELQDAGTE
mgnify:CR=1 FL=1